jgi:hypothetical protein
MGDGSYIDLDRTLALYGYEAVKKGEIARLQAALTEIRNQPTMAAWSANWMREIAAAALAGHEAGNDAANQWIPIGERLPEPGQIVIGWHAYAKKAIQYTFTVDAEYTAPGHFVDGDCCFCEDITHWMRLPEPPTHNAKKDGAK